MVKRQNAYAELTAMRDLIRDNDFLLYVISRFDIAFGFGDKNVGEVCAENNVHAPTFLEVCDIISGYGYDSRAVSMLTFRNLIFEHCLSKCCFKIETIWSHDNFKI